MDHARPEDLSCQTTQATHKHSSWASTLAHNLSNVCDEFFRSGPLSEDVAIHNFCLHFFWCIQDYAVYIFRCFRDDDLSELKVALVYTLPFVVGKSLKKIDIKNKNIQDYLDALIVIIDECVGTNASYSLDVSIAKMHMEINLLRKHLEESNVSSSTHIQHEKTNNQESAIDVMN